MPKKNQKLIPDAALSANFSELFDKVFGTSDEPNDEEEQKRIILSLRTYELIALGTYLGQFKKASAAISEALSQAPSTDFPAENSLFTVIDEETGKSIGGLTVKTKKSFARSTQDKRVSERVKQALTENGLLATYTRQSVELNNDLLFKDNANGVLPQAVASLLIETEKTERTSSYVTTKSLKGDEE